MRQKPADYPTIPAALKTLAMPADTNASGDIFGGWLLSQMDLAGANVAYEFCQNAVVTVGIDAMSFHQPVFVGDVVICFGEVVRVGRTSISVKIETWAHRRKTGEYLKVTEGMFTFVSVGPDRKPQAINRTLEDAE